MLAEFFRNAGLVLLLATSLASWGTSAYRVHGYLHRAEARLWWNARDTTQLAAFVAVGTLTAAGFATLVGAV